MLQHKILTKKLPPLIAFALVAIGFGLRLYALDRESLWYDELLQLDIAQGALDSIWPALYKHAALPLDYLLSHVWIVLGRSEAWVRLPAVFSGMLTLPLAYQLGRKLLDEWTALVLMGLLAISPFHIHYSQEARPYALLVLGVVLAGYALWQLHQTGRWSYVILLFAGALIFALAHFFAIVIFIPWLLFAGFDFITSRRRERALKVGGALLASGAVALVIILVLGWGQTLWNVAWWDFRQTLVESKRFTLEAEEKPKVGSAPRVDWAFVKNRVLAPLGPDSKNGTTLSLFNGLALLGLAYLLIRKRYKLSLLLLLWLIVPVATIVAFLVHRGEFFAPRYILSVLPAYLTLVSVGILALPRWLKRTQPGWLSPAIFVILLLLTLAGLSGALAQYYHLNEKEDWRLVGQFISRNARPEDAVIAVNAEATMNWYYPPAMVEADTYDDLESIKAKVAHSERSWVIMSIFAVYLGEREAQIKAWLGEQGAIRLVLDPIIAVYYLGPKASPDQLLAEIQGFALPVDHALYASLARENRHRPEVAAQYFRLAIKHAPDEATQAQYQAEMEALIR